MSRIEQVAYQYRLNHGIDDFPCNTNNLIRIVKLNGCIVKTYKSEEIKKYKLFSKCESNEAFTTLIDKRIYVFYDPDISEEKLTFALAHELGHISCGHYWYEHQEDWHEDEADEFAFSFLAPLCYLSMLNIKSSEDISGFTGLERTKCEILYGRLIEYRKKNKSLDATENALIDLLPATKRNVKKIIVDSLVVISSIIISALMLISSFSSKALKTDVDIPFASLPEITEEIIEPESNVVSSLESEDTIVYITVTGKKYHLPDCQYINNKSNLTDMYVHEAESYGYKPCSICFK